MTTPAFHGTPAESFALAVAIERNCMCDLDPETGNRITCCPVHDALVHDQRWLNGLVFMRRIRYKLERDEWLVK